MFSRVSAAEIGFLSSLGALLLFLVLGVPLYFVALTIAPLLVCALALLGKHFGPALLLWAMSRLAERSIR